MTKHFYCTLLCLAVLSACSMQAGRPADASEAEIQMATMMGISVQELRSQTPQEHMRAMQAMMHGQTQASVEDATDVSLYDRVQPMETVRLQNGDTYAVNPQMARTNLNGSDILAYAYNGQIPGPLLSVQKGDSIIVDVQNNIDVDTTVHWHGLRLENKNDGVPGMTQDPIQPGGSFRYTLDFPDAGVYWYHPHVREDIQQDRGLYGLIIVEDPVHPAEVNQTVPLVLDDILLRRDGSAESYGEDGPRFALMGRFGNTVLTNGRPSAEYTQSVPAGSVIRYAIANVANTRTFRFTVPGARMKMIGSDIDVAEKEAFVSSVTIAPAERMVVDVYFEKPGTYTLTHKSPLTTATLGSVTVTESEGVKDFSVRFLTEQERADMKQQIDAVREHFDDPIAKTLRLGIEMQGPHAMMNHGSMMDHTDDGIEWEDMMPAMNASMTSDDLSWFIEDTATGKRNMDIDWSFGNGEIVKLKVVNDGNSAHPMQHPLHIHGQRFLVLSIDGKKNENLMWKDTVLIPTGVEAELLVEMTNPGHWMFHCHIAEHLSNGMMGAFTVE